ncbi:MAG: acetylxylan esterase, partial [Muribaculaceae bacterium]|nr:acetylxylan esterase [Muribaculaceae bacterium]
SYYSAPESKSATPNADGFIGRWLMLEPIDKPNRSNTVFTDSYLRDVFNTDNFPGQLSSLPKDGEKVKVGKQTLKWHSLDSKLFNVKLFRFATGLEKQYYGVLFRVVTAIDCEEEIPNVRMSVGSNSASMWWLNGEEAVILSGDRRMVMDDCLSKRLTLKKGRNIIRGAIINGPGMSDFCLRFLNENGTPITNFTISNI